MKDVESKLFMPYNEAGHRVDKDEALWKLRSDIATAQKKLTESYVWYKELDHPRRDALIIVLITKGEIKEELSEHIAAGDFDKAAKLLAKDKRLAKEISCQMKTGQFVKTCNC